MYFEFEGETVITKDTRTVVFSALTGVGTLALLVFCLLRPVTDASRAAADQLDKEASNSGTKEQKPILDPERGPLEALKASGKLLTTRDMSRLVLTFCYTGVELSFITGVYSGAIGFTEAFGEDRTKFVGISGMLMGVGEILGTVLSVLKLSCFKAPECDMNSAFCFVI